MKINHTWKPQAEQKPPKFVPYDQHQAALKIMQRNSYEFAVQLMCDLAVLAAHEAYGFREKHMMKFRYALAKEISGFSESVNWEFKAETNGMSHREREKARPDLAYTMEKMDQRLKELVPEEDFQPFQKRYGGFGGRVSWGKRYEKEE